jgi:SAM-dependent methyltransferase
MRQRRTITTDAGSRMGTWGPIQSDAMTALTGDPHVPLPPTELRFMNENDERMVSVGQGLADVLRRHGLGNEDMLLDVGSGYGRLAIGLMTSGFGGSYHGIEILKKHVTWCQTDLQPANPRYRFTHLDVRNGRYNPAGMVLPTDVRFPVDSDSCDGVALFSVFTHMYEADIARYLREIRRVLRPGGTAVTTWFLFNKDRLGRATSPESTPFPMVNEINAVTRYNDSKDPLRAIAYRERYVRRMIDRAGLNIREVEYGRWCGDQAAEFQDILALTPKQPTEPNRGRRWLRR